MPLGRPGPGVVLLHQVNRDRKSWEDVAARLAAAGINTLTLDMRGFGGTGGIRWEKLNDAQLDQHWRGWPQDVEDAFEFLRSQPGVARQVIGLGGAGLLGVDNAVETARHHSIEVKSLVLILAETFRDGLKFLHEASDLPGLFVTSDDEEYPPSTEAMLNLYATSSNPGKKLVHYSASHDAPWLWFEPFDIGTVPATGRHGTDLFKPHPDLPGIIVDWFVTTLVKTPGHAPADAIAAADILSQLRAPDGISQVREQLLEARRKDPQVQLWPGQNVDILGADYQRVGDIKSANEVFKLNLLAYPDSADANASLADALLDDAQKDLTRGLFDAKTSVAQQKTWKLFTSMLAACLVCRGQNAGSA